MLDNDGYASIRSTQRAYFAGVTWAAALSGLTLPDTLKLAAAYGLPTAEIRDHADIRGQVHGSPAAGAGGLQRASRPTRPPPRGSLLPAVPTADGLQPMEDMWPLLDREDFKKQMLIDKRQPITRNRRHAD